MPSRVSKSPRVGPAGYQKLRDRKVASMAVKGYVTDRGFARYVANLGIAFEEKSCSNTNLSVLRG